jgi:hypothetical protein
MSNVIPFRSRATSASGYKIVQQDGLWYLCNAAGQRVGPGQFTKEHAERMLSYAESRRREAEG